MTTTATPTTARRHRPRLRTVGRSLAASGLAAALLLGTACGDDDTAEPTAGTEVTPVAARVDEAHSLHDLANPADKGSHPSVEPITSIYEVANPADKGSHPA
ncbi:hypothetical protein HC251_07695 [Iamia sp. SCSIO 61187]|uniref:hypothetical protein n=1 Tax=Iamia sp. SCSIO 61187 TaxID=2722752 RepID=UPI001C627F29|nr:hypothetical protein [Iamia sp. SCSIO 61187]QYG92334.1 hypothetical protein HC251_07695 [Iamia sp. SCSIO 61187]